MNFQDDPDLKRKLEDMEADLHRTQPITGSSQSSESEFSKSAFSKSMTTYYKQFLAWFQDLPKVGQIVVGVIGVAAALALVKALVQLISLAFSLAVIAVVGYGAYQIFKSLSSSKS
ncbi:MAG: hypothetical protein ACRC8A_10470 [Microcoleaceae cyanobacterium]